MHLLLTSARKWPAPHIAIWAVFFLLFLFAAILLTPWQRQLSTDGAAFINIARAIMEGGAPYRDVFDNKPPLLFLVTAFSLMVGDTFQLDAYTSVRILSVISAVVIGLSLMAMLRHHGKSWLASGLTGLAGVIAFSLPLFSAGGGSSEPPAFALGLLAWMLAEKTTKPLGYLAVGFLFAASISISFVVIPLGLGCAWALLRRPSRWQALSWSIIGGSMVAGAIFAYVQLNGIWPNAIDNLVEYNRLYAANKIGRRGAHSPADIWLILLLLMPPAVGIVWRRPPLRVLLTLGALVAMSSLALLRAPNNHYYWPLLVSLVLLAGWGSAEIWSRLRRRQIAAVGLAIIWVLGSIIGLAGIGKREAMIAANNADRVAAMEVIKYQLDQLPTDQPLFVWGIWSNLFLESERPRAGLMVNIFSLTVPGYTTPQKVHQVCQMLLQRKPIIVVDGTEMSFDLDGKIAPGLPAADFMILKEAVYERWERYFSRGQFQILTPRARAAEDGDACL